MRRYFHHRFDWIFTHSRWDFTSRNSRSGMEKKWHTNNARDTLKGIPYPVTLQCANVRWTLIKEFLHAANRHTDGREPDINRRRIFWTESRAFVKSTQITRWGWIRPPVFHRGATVVSAVRARRQKTKLPYLQMMRRNEWQGGGGGRGGTNSPLGRTFRPRDQRVAFDSRART